VRYSAISPTIANRLLTYACQKQLQPDHRIFPITPSRAWHIFHRAFESTGIRKPDRVSTTHVIRHSGAIERLAATRNPKATSGAARPPERQADLAVPEDLERQGSPQDSAASGFPLVRRYTLRLPPCWITLTFACFLAIALALVACREVASTHGTKSRLALRNGSIGGYLHN